MRNIYPIEIDAQLENANGEFEACKVAFDLVVERERAHYGTDADGNRGMSFYGVSYDYEDVYLNGKPVGEYPEYVRDEVYELVKEWMADNKEKVAYE